MNKTYQQLAQPPKDALRAIEVGNLKGKSDINPQWKIEALTEAFGLCGEGWKFEMTDTKTVECKEGQVLLYMRIAFYYKLNDKWSEPVYGFGGDFIVKKNKNGLVPNDEAYKMCLTDALGNAIKNIGVAADIYRGLWDGAKYIARDMSYAEANKPITDNEVKALLDLSSTTKTDVGSMLEYFGCKTVETMTRGAYKRAIDILREKALRAARAEKQEANEI